MIPMLSGEVVKSEQKLLSKQFAPGLGALPVAIDNASSSLVPSSKAPIKASTQLRSSSSRTLK
jgi:hypothetical protein